jgi:hypothetical protein
MILIYCAKHKYHAEKQTLQVASKEISIEKIIKLRHSYHFSRMQDKIAT